MLSEKASKFLSENHNGVLTTFRRNGAAQMSIVTCGLYGNGVAFTTTADRAKLLNMKRDPRCSLLVSKPEWWGFIVLEGHAEIMSPEDTDADKLRLALRDVYKIAAGEDHPDWDDYDQAMIDQCRSAVIVVPERIYGTAL